MNTTEETHSIPAELRAQLQQALGNLAKGVRDPKAAKQASERMDRMREENRKLFGEQDIAVEIVRGMRDSQ